MKLPNRRILAALAIVIALLLVAVVYVGCKKRSAAAAPAQNATAQAAEAPPQPVSVMVARRGTIREELALTGSCQSTEELDVVPEVMGKVVEVMADVGQRVRAGQPLVRLDTSLAAQQRVQAEKGVVSAAARVTQAEQGAVLTDRETLVNVAQAQQGLQAALQGLAKSKESYRLTSEQASSRLEQAKVGVATAEAQQRDTESGARTQELAQSEASVRSAEADASLQKSNYDRYRRLFDQGAVAEATLESYRTQNEVSQQRLAQAREALSLAREGARRELRRVASLGVDNAHEQLRQAEAGMRQVDIAARDVESSRVGVRQAEENIRLAKAGRLRVNVSHADIRAAQAGLGQAAAAHTMAQVTEGKYVINSPMAGTVASRSVDIGEGASPGLPVMRIVNSNPIRVDCQVSELDVDKVKVGDEGVTTVDGLPGQEFVGRVMAVTPQAVKNERNYIARVAVDNPQATIKSGMFARVKLVISEKSDVVIVTRDCLAERGEERHAYVVTDGVIKVRKVKVGVTNGVEMEILDGVRPGEQLVSAGQSMLADGQKVTPVTTASGEPRTELPGAQPPAKNAASTPVEAGPKPAPEPGVAPANEPGAKSRPGPSAGARGAPPAGGGRRQRGGQNPPG